MKLIVRDRKIKSESNSKRAEVELLPSKHKSSILRSDKDKRSSNPKYSIKKLGRRNSAESMLPHHMIGITSDSRKTLGSRDCLFSNSKTYFKSPQAHYHQLISRMNGRNSEKSSNSKTKLNSGLGSTIIPSSSVYTIAMDDIKRIYSNKAQNSPKSRLNTKYFHNGNKNIKSLKILSPKESKFNPNQMMKTANLLSIFRDMSKKISTNLSTTNMNGETIDCKNKSSSNISQKNKKFIQKRGVVPPSNIMYLTTNKDKCSKCKSNQNKSKSKLSTRK